MWMKAPLHQCILLGDRFNGQSKSQFLRIWLRDVCHDRRGYEETKRLLQQDPRQNVLVRIAPRIELATTQETELASKSLTGICWVSLTQEIQHVSRIHPVPIIHRGDVPCPGLSDDRSTGHAAFADSDHGTIDLIAPPSAPPGPAPPWPSVALRVSNPLLTIAGLACGGGRSARLRLAAKRCRFRRLTAHRS